MPREVDFLMRRYGMDAETAAEVLRELRDTQSLQRLAEYRGQRAVASTPPNKF
jgi:hypothetical protein